MAGTDASILARETYVAANGTNLSSFTGWTDAGVTDITVLNNRLINDGASGGAPSYYIRGSSTPAANAYAVEAGIWLQGPGGRITIFPALSGAFSGYGFGWDDPTDSWIIERLDSGTPAGAIASAEVTPTYEQLYRVVYRRDGDRHRLYVDDVEVIDVTDGTHSDLTDLQLISTADVDATQGGHIEYLESGRWMASGGSAATVEVEAVGVGSKAVAGGTAVAVDVTVVGAGTRGTTGGSTVTVEVAPAGSGTATRQGGAATVVEVVAVGAGQRPDQPQGGSDAFVELVALGAGAKTTASGSGATVEVALAGAGAKHASGGSAVMVDVVALGAGRIPTEGALAAEQALSAYTTTQALGPWASAQTIATYTTTQTAPRLS